MKYSSVAKIVFAALATAVIVSFSSCAMVDSAAQRAAEAELIDRHTANAISLSAKAFMAANEKFTPEQEYYIGRAVATNILSMYDIWEEEPELTAYLNLICAAVVLNSPKPTLYNGYFVAILDTNEVNAFATSGGHIFLTRGIINAAKSEDALAAVIAHEVSHIQLQHGIKAIKSDRVNRALLVTAATTAGAVTGGDLEEMIEAMDESVGEIIQTMVNSGYSKEAEYEADIAAMFLMNAAGYNPARFIDMLKALDSNTTRSSRFNKTHPLPVQRIYYAERMLKRMEASDTTLIRQERFNTNVNTIEANDGI